MDPETIIELKHVTKIFEDDFTAVDDTSLEIKRGEFVTFLGPSGCGKTTTLRMIAGFDTPTSGEILLNGKDITHLPPYERPINTVFQRYALFPHMNIFENIAFGLKQKGRPKTEIARRVTQALALVDLEGFEKRRVATLSGGQQQRVAIARALVNEPEILLLDEPLGALDLKMRKEMQIELIKMHETLGITFIYVTHDQEEALTMSDKIVVMNNGKIQQVGTPEDIYNEPTNIFVADFIGESNIFSGIMTDKLNVRFCGGVFAAVDEFPTGTLVTAIVRPEDVVLVTDGSGMIEGVVTSVLFRGVHYEMTVQSGKNEIVVQSIDHFEEGTQVGIRIPPAGIHLIEAQDYTNVFRVDVDREGELTYGHSSIGRMIQDVPGIDAAPILAHPDRYRLVASIAAEDIEMTDRLEDGLVHGTIQNMIYQGSHYLYIIQTDGDHDFAVYDEDLWNMNDHVGLILPPDKITFTVRK